MTQPVQPSRSRTERAIQGLILFSTLLGALFLVQAYGTVPAFVFDFIAIGWVLFVFDSLLTFVRRQVSYLMGFFLAILALASSLPQPTHWAFLTNGDIIPAATLVIGSLAQSILIIVVAYHFVVARRAAT
jgi:hypothetical protein